MGEQRTREVAIGVFVLAGLGLVGVMFWVLENQAFQPKYRIFAEFTYAGGIREGTPVHMAGKPIGQVKDVQFRDDAASGKVLVDVVVEIDEKYTIRRDSKLTVGSVGLLGEKILEFTLGTDAEVLPKDGTARITGTVPPGLEDLQKTIDGAVGDLRVTVTKVNAFLDQLNDPEFQAGLKGTVTGVNSIAGKVQGTVDRIDGFVEKADAVAVKAGEAADSVNRILLDAEAFVKQLNQLAEKVSGALEELQGQVVTAGDSFNALAESLQENSRRLNEILASVDGLVKGIRAGEGTLGHLVTDKSTARKLDELLVSLKTTSESLSATSDYLRQNPNSILFGRDKDETPAARPDWRDRK
ncbi:MAG: MCE family protein [Candidatus Brocadiae bacterium]|nr:MCE family protein [Candidatus Brocadiia bacterium]